MPCFETTRRVEFCDTDAAGIMHFSAYITMMEQAEHELLRSVGLSVMMEEAEGIVSWPRVSVHCDYRGAARFEEVLRIQVVLRRLGEKSVTYGFRFLREEAMIAEGQLTAVCCRFVRDQPLQSIAIPDAFREALAPYVESSSA